MEQVEHLLHKVDYCRYWTKEERATEGLESSEGDGTALSQLFAEVVHLHRPHSFAHHFCLSTCETFTN